MVRILLAACGLAFAAHSTTQADWPLFGGTPARNMVNLKDRNIPTDWCVDKAKPKNIKWSAELGMRTYGSPVVAGGRVFVGTTERDNRNFRAAAMCFRESDGKFLWQTLHDIPNEAPFDNLHGYGLLSTPTVVGDRLYYLLPQATVICADVANGKILWQYGMRKELKVIPFHTWETPGDFSPLVVGDLVYLVTGNGIDDETGKPPQPQAPSFIALNKNTGKLVWQSNLPGDRVIEGQWSNPAYALIQGKGQVIFAGGDATIYSFEPLTGKLIWKFHCYPNWTRNDFGPIDSYFVSTPVIHDNKVYIGLGVNAQHPRSPRHSFFLCIDATRTGDVSAGNPLPARLALNVNSALLWCYGGSIEPRPKKDRIVVFGPTISTCAVHNGLVYIPEVNGYMHCLDARTGKRQWVDDLKTTLAGSPYYVDGKIYYGTEDGEIVIYQAGKQLNVINKIDMEDTIRCTPVVANGVLFVATRSHLYAIAGK